jgi:hypothetical protein
MRPDECIGYSKGLDYYCQDCVPNTDFEAIFGDAETDLPHHCNTCDALIPERLCPDGMDEVIGRLCDYLISRKGSKKRIHMWCHEWQGDARNDTEREIFKLAFWATSDEKREHRLINILDRET